MSPGRYDHEKDWMSSWFAERFEIWLELDKPSAGQQDAFWRWYWQLVKDPYKVVAAPLAAVLGEGDPSVVEAQARFGLLHRAVVTETLADDRVAICIFGINDVNRWVYCLSLDTVVFTA